MEACLQVSPLALVEKFTAQELYKASALFWSKQGGPTRAAFTPGGGPGGLPWLGCFPQGKVLGMPLLTIALLGVWVISCQCCGPHRPGIELAIHMACFPAQRKAQRDIAAIDSTANTQPGFCRDSNMCMCCNSSGMFRPVILNTKHD